MAGEVAGGDGPAYVEGLLAARGLEARGSSGQSSVEVDRVGQVELALDEAGAGEGDLVVVDGEMPPVRGSLRGLGCLGGHEPGHGLGDQPVQLRGPDPVGEPRDLGIDESGRLQAQPQGGCGDPAGLPRHQPMCLDPRPDPGQAVLQLDPVGDQRPTGVGGHPQRDRELGHAELRDQRRPRTGQPHPDLTTRGPGRRVVDRLGRVLLGPHHRTDQHRGLRDIGHRPLRTDETEHVRGAVQHRRRGVPGRRHRDKSSSDHRQFLGPEPPLGKRNLESFRPPRIRSDPLTRRGRD